MAPVTKIFSATLLDLEASDRFSYAQPLFFSMANSFSAKTRPAAPILFRTSGFSIRYDRLHLHDFKMEKLGFLRGWYIKVIRRNDDGEYLEFLIDLGSRRSKAGVEEMVTLLHNIKDLASKYFEPNQYVNWMKEEGLWDE